MCLFYLFSYNVEIHTEGRSISPTSFPYYGILFYPPQLDRFPPVFPFAVCSLSVRFRTRSLEHKDTAFVLS